MTYSFYRTKIIHLFITTTYPKNDFTKVGTSDKTLEIKIGI